MEQRGLNALARLDLSSWFDYWHTHPDWEFRGNKCIENQQSVIELGYKFQKVAEGLCEKCLAPIQCWSTVCENTGNNAVYLHTENGNGTPFPYDFEGADWGSKDHPILNAVVNLDTHEIGKYTYPDEIIYVIRKRA